MTAPGSYLARHPLPIVPSGPGKTIQIYTIKYELSCALKNNNIQYFKNDNIQAFKNDNMQDYKSITFTP
jgi:hypothetical protein